MDDIENCTQIGIGIDIKLEILLNRNDYVEDGSGKMVNDKTWENKTRWKIKLDRLFQRD